MLNCLAAAVYGTIYLVVMHSIQKLAEAVNGAGLRNSVEACQLPHHEVACGQGGLGTNFFEPTLFAIVCTAL